MRILESFVTRQNEIDILSLSHPVNSRDTTHMHSIQDSPTGWLKEDGLTGESQDLKNDKAVELLGFCLLVLPHILD